MDKEKLKERHDTIAELLKNFCTAHLDEEYAELTLKLLGKLYRKKTTPLATGKEVIWAAGIIHAVGTINFMFDKSSDATHCSFDDLVNFFDAKKTTVTSKSKDIRDLFKMRVWDKNFSTQKMQGRNPMNSFVMVNGLILHIDSLPENIKEIARDLMEQGITPSFTITPA